MGGMVCDEGHLFGRPGRVSVLQEMLLVYEGSGWLLGTVRVVRASMRRVLDRCATSVWGLLLAEMGRGSRVSFGAVIVRPKHVHLGRGCFIERGARLTAEKGSGDLVLGDDVTVLAHAVLEHTGGLVIEDGAWISREVFIMTHDHGRDPRSYPTPSPLKIGRKAWIGLRAIVMPRVREIGEGAVIGAGAVLTRDAPAHSVMAGNPARVIDRESGVGNRESGTGGTAVPVAWSGTR